MKSFIAVVRQAPGGKGFKTAKESTYFSKPTHRALSIQPECSLENAPTYLTLYPRRYSQALMYGNVRPGSSSLTSPGSYSLFEGMNNTSASPTSSSGHPLQSRMFSSSTQLFDEVQNNTLEGAAPPPAEGEEPLSLYSSGVSAAECSDSAPASQKAPLSEFDQKRAKLAKGKVTVLKLKAKKKANIPITMLTAYDTPSARLADEAGIDMILVGDSVGMVALGEPNTVGVTMDMMIHHCKAVTAAAPKHSMVVGDMPFGSYLTVEDAVKNAVRLMKEGRVDAVKLEGGERIKGMVEALVAAGVVVVGHVGLCPQSAAAVGGFRVQGKTVSAAKQIISDAKAMEEAGVCCCVLEMVPKEVGELVSKCVDIPTIGIGAGSGCGGQVLVWHDLLGLYPSPPKFVKQMANVGEIIRDALENYVDEVETRSFPAPQHSSSLSSSVLDELKAHFGEDFFDAPPSSSSSSPPPPASSPSPSSPPASSLSAFSAVPPSSVYSSPDSPPTQSASFHSSSPSSSLSAPSVVEVENFLQKNPVIILGGGSMGSLFASRLSRYVPVLLVSSHSDHISSISENGGIKYERLGEEGREEEIGGPLGDLMAVDHSVLEGGVGKGVGKIVFVLTSGDRTQKAAEAAKELLDEKEGVVVTLQNGLGNERILEREVGEGKVLVGVTSQSAVLLDGGCVKHTGTQGMTTLLPSSHEQLRQSSFISSLLLLAGFPVNIETDEKIGEKMRWKKLATNCIINPLTSLLSVPNGGLLEEQKTLSLLPLLADEISQVADNKNIDLSANEIMEEVKHVASVTSGNVSSMRRAWEEGRAVEIEQINGSVVRFGESCGIETPVNSLLHSLVQSRGSLSSSSLLSSLPPSSSSSSLQSRMFSSTSSSLPETSFPLFPTLSSLRAHRDAIPASSPVLFVPTMGGLHEGHLDLIRHAKSLNKDGVTYVSIFVNPKQFAEGEDFGEYPRTIEEDLLKLEGLGGVGGVFLPKAEEIYGPSFKTFVDVQGIEEVDGEGGRRPGFFRGVATVCTVLMNLVRPNIAVFGQKDGMQCMVLKQITRDLQMGVDIHIVRTRREETGLAMSTRNGYLSKEEREEIAPLIYKSLEKVEEVGRKEGGLSEERAREIVEEVLSSSPLQLEYVTLTDWETSTPITDPSLSLSLPSSSSSSSSPLLVGENKKILVAVAAKLGNTRLLDNILL